MSTFVAVGNAKQSFDRLFAAVSEIFDALPAPVVVQNGHTAFDDDRCEAYRFMSPDRFLEEINRAELLVLHGGAGSLIQTLKAGKKPIVVPRLAHFGEHVDDHQLALCTALADQGRVTCVTEITLLRQAVEDLQAMPARGPSRRGMEEPEVLRIVAQILQQECVRHQQ